MVLPRSIVFLCALTVPLTARTSRVEAQARSDASVPHDARQSLVSLRARLERDPADERELRAISDEARALASAPESPSDVRGEALFYAADAADRGARYADALGLYRASLAATPGGRFAARARARSATLAPNEADAFVGLTELERFRRRIDGASASELRAFADRAARFDASPARTQARLMAASALIRRREFDPAAVILRAIAEDPTSGRDDRSLALHELSRVRAEQGTFARARDELSALGGDRGDIATAARLARRATLFRTAWGAMIAQWLVGLVALVQSVRAGAFARVVKAWKRPLPLVHLSVLTAGGALLTRSYDHHDASHVWAFGAGIFTVYLSASAASAQAHRDGAPARSWTIARVMIAVIAALAASFLAMHRFDQGMLDGISL